MTTIKLTYLLIVYDVFIFVATLFPLPRFELSLWVIANFVLQQLICSDLLSKFVMVKESVIDSFEDLHRRSDVTLLLHEHFTTYLYLKVRHTY